MKLSDTLTTLFEHHLWANLRLLQQCAQLNPDQLETTSPGAYGSLHDTLEHMVMAEQSYFSRISTGQRNGRSRDLPPMTPEEMLESIRLTGSGLIEWANKVQASDAVTLDWEGKPRDVPKTILLTQALNHATEHRTQVTAILATLGIEPVDLDAWTYFDAQDKAH